MSVFHVDAPILGGVLLTMALVLSVELWRRSRGAKGHTVWAIVWPLATAGVVYGSLHEPGSGALLLGALPFALLLAALAIGMVRTRLRPARPEAGVEPAPALGAEDRVLAQRILELRVTPVAQIMTPADRMAYALESSPIREVIDLVRRTGHSRIPILDAPGGRPLGFLHAKDLGPYLHDPSPGGNAGDLLREALQIPPKERASRLLESFRHRRVHLAVVTDTVGRAIGLVSLGDFYAHLLGDRSGSPPC